MTAPQETSEKRAELLWVIGALLMLAAIIGWVYFLNLVLRGEWECEKSLGNLLHDGHGPPPLCGEGEEPALTIAVLVLLTALGSYLTLRANHLLRYYKLKRRVDTQNTLLLSLKQRLDEQEARLAAGSDEDSTEERVRTRRTADADHDEAAGGAS